MSVPVSGRRQRRAATGTEELREFYRMDWIDSLKKPEKFESFAPKSVCCVSIGGDDFDDALLDHAAGHPGEFCFSESGNSDVFFAIEEHDVFWE